MPKKDALNVQIHFVAIRSVVSKTGDDGMTGVFGKRLPKDDMLIELIGELDELSAVVGVTKLEKIGEKINKDLYYIMGYLSGFNKEIDLTKDIELMESDIKRMEKPINKFLLPGVGMNVMINWARTVCRRAERRLVKYNKIDQKLDQNILIYINRLSDYLFVMSCKFESLSSYKVSNNRLK